MNPPPEWAARFWAKVKKSDGCWEWQAAVGSLERPYGHFRLKTKLKVKAHRLSWEMAFGRIPPGMLVCHKCDNPRCVNPAHLFLGTNADNAADKSRKGRVVNNPLRGEESALHRLKVDEVREIRRAWACRLSSETAERVRLAKKYGVHPMTIWFIVKRKTWTHV